MYYMSSKTVTRSIRLDEATNAAIEAQAAASGRTVSEFIRWAVEEATLRDVRAAGHQRAFEILASLPQTSDDEREEMWA
jgi:uncharacterized protein (DUF1778 family)